MLCSPTLSFPELELTSGFIQLNMAYTSAGFSNMRPPFGRLNVSQTQGETTAGEFWTVKKEGEDWPIVVCDEEMVQTFYKGRQRPFNSRQPDGTWPERYKAGEDGVSKRCYPTLLLGRLKP